MILATLAGGYAGADSTGQTHVEYPANTYILPVMCPVMFPPEFFIRSFERGIDGIILMYSGTDSPYKVEAEGTAKLINDAYAADEGTRDRYPAFATGRNLYRVREAVPQRSQQHA